MRFPPLTHQAIPDPAPGHERVFAVARPPSMLAGATFRTRVNDGAPDPSEAFAQLYRAATSDPDPKKRAAAMRALEVEFSKLRGIASVRERVAKRAAEEKRAEDDANGRGIASDAATKAMIDARMGIRASAPRPFVRGRTQHFPAMTPTEARRR